MGGDERALSESEGQVWMRLGAILELLPAALNSQLLKDNNLTLFDYYVLWFLRGSPERTMGISALAACSSATVPRMSKVASRLEAQGFVSREADDVDRRAVNVALTAAGERVLEDAAPAHLALVRRIVFDALSATQVMQLRGITSAILERLHPDATMPVDRHLPEDRFDIDR